MYDAAMASQSAPGPAQGPGPEAGRAVGRMQRVEASARIGFAGSGAQTRLKDLYQSGSARIRLPKVYGAPATAVLINTAGGLTGGDALDYAVSIGDGAHAIVTSQTAERAYRSSGGRARVTARMTVGSGAVLEWLPQETILFDASCLHRSIDAELAPDARLMMVESAVLGRKAMGEEVGTVSFRDSWRIRRGGKLVFADDIRLEGTPARFFDGPATAAGCHAIATFADFSPDAEDRLPLARAGLEPLSIGTVNAAASAWNGVLTARFVSGDSRDLRNALMRFLTHYRSADLPRVWYC